MLQLNNLTPFAAMLVPLADADGIDTVFAIVKGTFRLNARPSIADEQIPITMKDEYYGNPASTSIRAPSDISLEKLGTDVIVSGSAWAPGGEATWQTDVSVAVGPVRKAVRVFGDRVWDTSSGIASPSWVAPFTRMPLVWERAYGGRDETSDGPTSDARNPVGVGYRASNTRVPLAGQPLPNIEDPIAPIGSWSDKPTPAGFGAVAPSWLPRRAFAGTYDAAWQRNRAPYLPTDFNPRFCSAAAMGLSTPTHLTGGEPVELRGLTPDGVVRFALPTIPVQTSYELFDGEQQMPARLDLVWLTPDNATLSLVWRAALRCDKKMLSVREVTVTLGSEAQRRI